MTRLIKLGFAALSMLFAVIPAQAQTAGPLVLAAASLQESLTEVADAWTARGHAKPVLSFAASSALARQIEAGAPADLFISADEAWMDDVANKGLIKPETRLSFIGNRLVLIAPIGKPARVPIRQGFPLVRALGDGRLAMADPDSVPAGKYGKAALVKLDMWNGVETRIARAENVRAALALVERGEAPLGIVYKTDAMASTRVRIVGLFPEHSHPPITYPVAVLKASAARDAIPFRQFLTSPFARSIFERHGFIVGSARSGRN